MENCRRGTRSLATNWTPRQLDAAKAAPVLRQAQDRHAFCNAVVAIGRSNPCAHAFAKATARSLGLHFPPQRLALGFTRPAPPLNPPIKQRAGRGSRAVGGWAIGINVNQASIGGESLGSGIVFIM